MGMKHVITDLTTGETKIEDMPADVDPREYLRQQMDDCPLCKEARARGEVPQFGDAETLRAIMEDVARSHQASIRRPRPWMRRPRWRDLKRKAGRSS